MSKCGTSEKHCCWFKGTQCQYLEPSSVEGFTWRCSLRAQKTTWDEVHAMPEYVENIKPLWSLIDMPDRNCGDWPYSGESCNDCGEGK